jgi:uncharacterized protein
MKRENLFDPTNLEWTRFNGEEIEDVFTQMEIDLVKFNPNKFPLKIVMGIDSQVKRKKHIKHVFSIIFYREGNGGWVYNTSVKIPAPKGNERNYALDRLWSETISIVEVAKWLELEIMERFDLFVDAIHIDLNNDDEHLSNKVLAGCVGFVTAHGFEAKTKPYAWGASKVADRKTKG